MAETKNQKINVPAVLADTFGPDVKLIGIGSSEAGQTGKIQVTNPETGAVEEKTINLDKVLQDVGFQKPMFMEKSYNTPEEPFEENALSFKDKVEMNFASTPKQQLQLLKQKYADVKVVKNKDGNDEFVVKNNGAWQKASTSIGADIAGNIPEMLGGMSGAALGAVKGAVAGTAIMGPGIGTAVGAISGGIIAGGLGTAVAKLGEIKAAELLGIRTEEDGQVLGQELAKEAVEDMIWSTATLGAGKLAKNVVGRIASKSKIAGMLSSVYDNVGIDDWMKTMQSSDIARTVKAYVDLDVKWATKKLEGGFEAVQDALSPTTKQMNVTMQQAIKEFQRSASANFERGINTVKESGALDAAELNIKEIYQSYGKQLVDMGIAAHTENGFQLLGSKNIAKGVNKAGSPAAVRQLQTMFKKLDNIMKTGNGNFNNFQHFKDIKDSITAIEREAGIFNSSSYNSNVVRSMKQLGADLLSTAKNAVDATGKFVVENGKKIPAGEYMDKVNKNYYNFKYLNDELGDVISKADSSQDILKLAQDVSSSKKLNLSDGFIQMGQASGHPNAPKILDQLATLKASKNIAEIYLPRKSLKAAVVGAIAPTSATTSAMVTGVTGVAGKVNKGAEIVSKYTGLAHMNDFLRKMDPSDKAVVLTNQQMLDQLLSAIPSYHSTKEEATNMLMQQVPGAGAQNGPR